MPSSASQRVAVPALARELRRGERTATALRASAFAVTRAAERHRPSMRMGPSCPSLSLSSLHRCALTSHHQRPRFDTPLSCPRAARSHARAALSLSLPCTSASSSLASTSIGRSLCVASRCLDGAPRHRRRQARRLHALARGQALARRRQTTTTTVLTSDGNAHASPSPTTSTRLVD